jgi:hypothetical protein
MILSFDLIRRVSLCLVAATLISTPATAETQIIHVPASTDQIAAMSVCDNVEVAGGRVTIVPGLNNRSITAFCEQTNPDVIVARVDVYPDPINTRLHRVMVDRFREPATRFHPDMHSNEGPFDTDIIWPSREYPKQPHEACAQLHGRFAAYDLCYYDDLRTTTPTPQALLDLK